MEKTLNYLFNYVAPTLMVSILFIPFICVEGTEVNFIYLSPIKILFEKHIHNITNILFILLVIGYVIVAFLNLNKNIFKSQKILLVASTIIYFILFKVTSNINLNLLCAVLNLTILGIYILNYIREYLIVKKAEEQI